MSAIAIESSPARRPAAKRSRGWWLKRAVAAILLLVLELAGTGFVYQAVATDTDRRSLPAPGLLVDVDGTRMHIQCTGQGSPTVVLETGLGAWSSHWALIQPAVAEHTRVCSYDRAGLGWSQAGPTPRDARQIATELHDLLDASDVRAPFVIAGHSNGGLYARMFASLYPNEVVGLVLADPTPVDLFERLPSTRASFASVQSQAQMFQLLAPLGLVRLLVPGALTADFADYPRRARDEIAAINSVGQQWQGVALEVEALSSSMAQVAQTGHLGSRPLVVLSSTRGSAVSTEEALIKLQLDAEIAALSSDSRHVVVDGATHMGLASNAGHAAFVADALQEVLAAIRAARPLGPE